MKVSPMQSGDISTIWNPEAARGDYQLVGPQLASGNDLYTAVYISLFSDRIAEPTDVIPDGSGDPRGWIGDVGEKYPIGSRLWLLSRAKQTTSTLNAAQGFCVEAVQWMIDDGVVAKVDVKTWWLRRSAMGIHITFHQVDGTTVAMQFAYTWNES